MNKVLSYMFVVVFMTGFQGEKSNVKKWIISKGCSLKVDGSTNVNKFSCAILNYSIPDTILANSNYQQSVHLIGNIKLDINNFNCHNPVMTADLRKTLKAKEYPNLIIRFISINQYPGNEDMNRLSKGSVNIELAGISKRFEVNYKVVSAQPDYINLIGMQKIHFSDFKIAPPSRLGGMIRTNNELDVVFNLKMKVLD